MPTSRSVSKNSPFAADFSAFSKVFWDQVSSEDLRTLSPAAREDIVAQHARLGGRAENSVMLEFSGDDCARCAWEDRHTTLTLVTDDMAFLIDSVAALLSERRYRVEMLLHPRVPVQLNTNKKFIFDPSGTTRQSHLHIVLQGHLTTAEQKALQHDIEQVVHDVRFATKDWQAMRLRALETKQYLTKALGTSKELGEAYADFLDYIYDNNFTFLGCRSYAFKQDGKKMTGSTIKGSGLGLLSDDMVPAYLSDNGAPLPASLQEQRTKMPPLYMSKVNRLSTVHRRVPLDAVTVHHFDDNGNVIAETLFIGLFTSVTYSRSLRSIPYLKYKADAVIAASGFEPASHDGRALRHILEKYPRDELFQIGIPELKKTCLSILRLQERQRIALYCRADVFRRYVSCLVYIPRDRYDTRLRLKFQHILERELSGTCTNFTSSVDDSPLVRLLLTISMRQENHKNYDVEKIERLLQDAGRLWSEGLSHALHTHLENDSEADNLAQQYADAFSDDYRERYDFQTAVRDIDKIDACLSTGQMQIDFQHRDETFGLKIYTQDTALVLSDILPILENMGVRVLTEHPFTVRPAGATTSVIVQDFSLTCPSAISFDTLKPLFEEAFIGIRNGSYENDSLNALITRAGLPARDVMVVRTYVRYLRQAGLPFSLLYMEQAITAHPAIARDIVAYFHAKFTPNVKTRKHDAIRTRLLQALDAVTSIDHDRILRAVLTAATASLRTNFYQSQKEGTPKPYLSIKLESRAIDFLPNPKPYREIFVYSTRMEGIHLRNARIARGGIRWSDRPEDFRSEILGLMKAQTVKNAVIVPSGAKGGFIVKHPPLSNDRAALQAEGIECYRYLVRGLLDITDNYGATGKVIKPASVACHDGDDPYLVVAADKGTATFSDIANALSIEYGFWMNDAFASGGSAGYDHKAMGITARGAWESVMRHFREINHNTQTTPFDVVGVGDMAGDVFGNGMLLSPYIRLVGVFNHLHILCDPEPDAAKSFAERKRLFQNVLGWDHYNTKLLSKGGRFYSRKDKILDLTPEIQKRFDINKSKVTPSELISALLKARTDLLYLGGIGTFVKATTETNADASDRSNDGHRINGADLRACVVGEGANLGFTQRARIEFAGRGGRLNADFIDNSAGVDTSDHEVNIKILLSKVMAKSPARLNRAARDKLLKSMTNEVAKLVLSDNYQQTQAISCVEMRAAELLPAHQKFMQDLERDGALDRALEFLPDDETIGKRHAAGAGLTRPEIGILVSYAKMRLREELLASDIPDRADLHDGLIGYFPHALQEKFKNDILTHPLKREIVATVVANQLVNRLGPTFVKTTAQKYNVDAAAVVRAFVAAMTVLNLHTRYAEIEALDNRVPAATQLRAMRELSILLERQIDWFLAQNGQRAQIDPLVKTWAKPVTQYVQMITNPKTAKTTLTPAQFSSWQERVQTWSKDQIPDDLARFLASRTKLSQMMSILSLCTGQKSAPTLDVVARIYLPLGDIFGFSWLRTQIDTLPKPTRWVMEAAVSMEERLDQIQLALTKSILSARKSGKENALDAWLAAREKETRDIFVFLQDLRRSGLSDLTVLLVLLQKIERLV